jgi:hypothetical protein
MTNKLLAEIEENSQRMDDNLKRRIERREESVKQGLATVKGTSLARTLGGKD